MKFWTKLFSRYRVLFLIASPISVNFQIVTSLLNAHQEAELGTEIAHAADSTPRSAEFRTLPFYIGVSPLLHQTNSLLRIEQS